jgi:hypothetical protein
MQKKTTDRNPLVTALIALMLLSVIGPLRAGQPVYESSFATLDSTPEPATCAVIGGALCLVSFRLRRRKR